MRRSDGLCGYPARYNNAISAYDFKIRLKSSDGISDLYNKRVGLLVFDFGTMFVGNSAVTRYYVNEKPFAKINFDNTEKLCPHIATTRMQHNSVKPYTPTWSNNIWRLLDSTF